MQAGRELDQLVAEHILGHSIIGQRKGTIKERTRSGQVRPLRAYSTDIAAAWEVVQKLGITLIPIENESWFAFVGGAKGWQSPAQLIESLAKADFVNAGAAVADAAPLAICIAGIKACEKRELTQLAESQATGPH